jgi:hypothetical protein
MSTEGTMGIKEIDLEKVAIRGMKEEDLLYQWGQALYLALP